jgi:hypothetical protein
MNITEERTSELVEATRVRLADGSSSHVFRLADGTFGNNTVGFGYESIAQVVAVENDRPVISEWAGIRRGMKAGAL